MAPGTRKATVIGGQGFVGRRLVSRLVGDGWRCEVPERDARLSEEPSLGHVFYCAGLTADYLRRPFDTVEAHTGLISRILAGRNYESLVYLSSTRLYDSHGDVLADESMPLVLDPANSRHLYDLTKATGESICRVAGDGRARIARLSCVYNDATDADGFLPALLGRCLAASRSAPADRRIAVDSSPGFARDYVALDDVVEAIVLIATRGTELIYNVASGENVRNSSLFATLEGLTGCSIVPTRDDAVPPAPRISIRRMRDEFGWAPISLADRLRVLVTEQSVAEDH